jgi:hypothetical protein
LGFSHRRYCLTDCCIDQTLIVAAVHCRPPSVEDLERLNMASVRNYLTLFRHVE